MNKLTADTTRLTAFALSLSMLAACSTADIRRVIEPEPSNDDARFEPEAAPERPAPVATTAVAAPQPAARPATPPQPRQTEPEVPAWDGYLDYVASHCVVDRFLTDRYSIELLQARGQAPLDEKRPHLPANTLPPSPGDLSYPVYAAQLKADWRANPRSHVLDCSVEVAPRDCPTCKNETERTKTFRYGIYVPKQFVETPGTTKSVLLLAPGGRGGRVRWFLEPEAYKVNKKRMTQGLGIQAKLDTHLEEHPELLAPLVITMDDPGFGYTNGTGEFMTHDLVQHILATYLPGRTRDDIAYGVDAISSGSKNAAMAFVDKPEAFDTFGWMCTFCSDDGGFDPDRYFREGRAGENAMKVWGGRAAKGDLHMKFSIGKNDPFLGCNQKMHTLLVEGGVIANEHEPMERDCADNGQGKQGCVTVRPAMTEYPDVGHNYSLMPLAFDEHLYWHVEKLTVVAQGR